MRVWGAAFVAGVMMTGAAHAQAVVVSPGVVVASDIDGPYDDVGPPLPAPPRYAPRPYPQAYPPPPGYAPPVYAPSAYGPPLPIHEIMRIVRQGGFSPLGAPQMRGNVVMIAVIDPEGEDGRLVIDAYSGRIIRFVPAYRMGGRSMPGVPVSYGPSMGPALRPPATIPAPGAAVPLPKPRVAALQPMKEKTGTTGAQLADPHTRIPAAPPAALAAAPTVAAPASVPAAKPPATLQPTQPMPQAQGLE